MTGTMPTRTLLPGRAGLTVAPQLVTERVRTGAFTVVDRLGFHTIRRTCVAVVKVHVQVFVLAREQPTGRAPISQLRVVLNA